MSATQSVLVAKHVKQSMIFSRQIYQLMSATSEIEKFEVAELSYWFQFWCGHFIIYIKRPDVL